jgi:hypothetical protein
VSKNQQAILMPDLDKTGSWTISLVVLHWRVIAIQELLDTKHALENDCF